jgi:hypothetical protein
MKSRVERSFIGEANLRKFLETRIQETVSDEELRVETLTLRLFGFIPADYDLKGSTVSLLTEQAAAFYDYRKKKMFILESAPESTQRFVLTHELAHALADQHFNLGRFIRKGSTDDAATARLAVMEGQAQWLMYEVMGAKTCESLRKDPGLVRMMANMGESGLSQYPELTSAPVYIRESLLFPYSRGFLFNARVIEKLGNDGFREVFLAPRPPPSTSSTPTATSPAPKPSRSISNPPPKATKCSSKAPSANSTASSCSSSSATPIPPRPAPNAGAAAASASSNIAKRKSPSCSTR